MLRINSLDLRSHFGSSHFGSRVPCQFGHSVGGSPPFAGPPALSSPFTMSHPHFLKHACAFGKLYRTSRRHLPAEVQRCVRDLLSAFAVHLAPQERFSSSRDIRVVRGDLADQMALLRTLAVRQEGVPQHRDQATQVDEANYTTPTPSAANASVATAATSSAASDIPTASSPAPQRGTASADERTVAFNPTVQTFDMTVDDDSARPVPFGPHQPQEVPRDVGEHPATSVSVGRQLRRQYSVHEARAESSQESLIAMLRAQTSCSRDVAVRALEASANDLADAILLITSEIL